MSIMLVDLPHDVHESIFNNMHVKDRSKFLMSLPKHIRSLPAFAASHVKQREKKLGGLCGAIKKKYVTRITDKIVQFLATCQADDPTVLEIVSSFPGLKVQLDNRTRQASVCLCPTRL